MPRIQPYDAPALAIQPNERGTNAREIAARRTAGFYNQAAEEVSGGARAISNAQGDIDRSAASAAEATATFARQQEDFAGHREVVAGSAFAAKLNASLSDQWDAMIKNADPNDPTVAAKFRETVLEPALEQLGTSYSNTDRGAQWSEAHVASMRNHFFQKTAADSAMLAGEAVKTSARTVINQNSNAAFKSPDFHTVDYLIDQTESSVGAIVSSSPVLKGADSARVRTEALQKAKESIIKSAAQGAIMKAGDPERIAQSFADRYPDFINGAEAKRLAVEARTQAKTNALQDKQNFILKKQMADYQVHQGASQIMTDNVQPDPTTPGKMIIKPDFFNQALDLPRKYPDSAIAATTAKTMLDWGQHQQNQRAQPIISDPTIKADLMTRMFDPNNPTSQTDILKAEVDGKIGSHDGTTMRALQKSVQEAGLHGEGFKETMTAVKGVLTYSMPGFPGKDPKGMENYARFVQDFLPKYQQAVRNNTLPPNALDTSDPKSMISQSMAQYQRTAKQKLDDRLSELSGLNLTGEGKEITGVQVIDIPAGMSPADALKTYGKGKTIRLPDGRTKVLQ